jgi:cytochrome c553
MAKSRQITSLIAASHLPAQTGPMIARTRSCAFPKAAALCGMWLLTPTAGTVEVESDAIEGRTEAAIADFRSAMELEPNLHHGAKLYSTCAACHSANGLGTEDGSIPAIAGQHVSVLVKQLVDFRHDRRWDERMRNFASQHHLSGPQELLDVAAYAASLPRWPPLEGGAGEDLALHEGYVVYQRDCAACHGPLGLGELRRMRPRLAGQRYQYLLRQLDETADRMRPGMDVEHVKLIGAHSPEERRAVADYLSRLSPNLASTQGRSPKPP